MGNKCCSKRQDQELALAYPTGGYKKSDYTFGQTHINSSGGGNMGGVLGQKHNNGGSLDSRYTPDPNHRGPLKIGGKGGVDIIRPRVMDKDCEMKRTTLDSPLGKLELSGCEQGLHRIIFLGKGTSAADAVEVPAPAAVLGGPEPLIQATAWLNAYFHQPEAIEEFPVPALHHPVFQQESFTRQVLWKLLKVVKFGEVISESHLAALVGNPAATAAVNTALDGNPVPILIPCHRVVQGDSDVGPYLGGLAVKEWLLAHEGHRLGKPGLGSVSGSTMDKDCEMKRTTLDSPLGKLELSGCEQGLHRIIFLGKGTSAADAVEVPAPAAVLGGPEPLIQATAWLNAYFHQPEAIEEFPVPALHHPVFQQESFTRQVLWKLLKVVKFGEVISESHLAALVGNPAATAAVNTALDGNPVPILIPCHRVVQGDSDVGPYLGGLAVKEWLLAHEGHRLGKPGLGVSGSSTMDKDCEMKRTTLDSPLGKLELSGCEQGLHRIIFLGKGTSAADAVEVPAPAAVLGGPEPLIQATAWLNAYFHQPEAIEEFPVPALHHPVFQQESFTRQVLWKLLKVVKFGEVISESHLAALVGNPAATAAVNTALDGNPVPILIPCHRVVQGDSDVGPYLGGLAVKEWLLAHEGHRLGKPGLGSVGSSSTMDKDCEMKRTTLDSPLGKLELSGCEQGLHRIIFLGKGTSAADAVEVPAPAAVLGGPEPLIQATAWLNAYFHQPEAIEEFPVPALHHPVFQQESFTRQVLWKLLKVVKFGEVISESHLAALVGNPAATAAVNTALDGNPVPILIPCHRVVQGDSDVGPYLGGLAVKEWLLAHEGHRLGKPGLG
nr:myr/CLIPf [synthetic construct]AQS79230.1 myr/CLIPf [synthetic construct]